MLLLLLCRNSLVALLEALCARNKLMPCGTKEMTAIALTKSLPYPSVRTHRNMMLDATSQQKMLETTSLRTSACWTWASKRHHATGEPLNVPEDGGASRIHVCVCVKAGGTLSAPQTLSLDWAVSKRQSAWEHNKDGGARSVHSRLYQRLTVSTRQVPESTMPLLDWAV